MSRRFALLVNPVSAGGRPLKLLPAVRDELERLGAGYRVVETRSLEHAKEEARGAAQAGETVVAVGGDGSPPAAGTTARACWACRGTRPWRPGSRSKAASGW